MKMTRKERIDILLKKISEILKKFPPGLLEMHYKMKEVLFEIINNEHLLIISSHNEDCRELLLQVAINTEDYNISILDEKELLQNLYQGHFNPKGKLHNDLYRLQEFLYPIFRYHEEQIENRNKIIVDMAFDSLVEITQRLKKENIFCDIPLSSWVEEVK